MIGRRTFLAGAAVGLAAAALPGSTSRRDRSGNRRAAGHLAPPGWQAPELLEELEALMRREMRLQVDLMAIGLKRVPAVGNGLLRIPQA